MTPVAEVAVDVDVVRALLRAQHPDLAELPLVVAAQGWDNVQVRIGTDLVARLPRRASAVALLENERRWLPELAELLPVPVPEPVRVGRPGAGYPWPWAVVRWCVGVRSADRPRASRTAWADDLARALAALHVVAPHDAPHNPVRAVPLTERADAVTARLTQAAELSWALPLWHRGVAAPVWDGLPVWVHGDPHPGNVLVTPAGSDSDSLAALLDFGDISSGDPACDLAAAWLHFDEHGRARFRAAYERSVGAGSVGARSGLWDRAAAWALSMASGVVALAPDDNTNGPWARETLVELHRDAFTAA